MQIHELPVGSIGDTNKLPFDTGANTYSVSFANLATYIRDKLNSLTFSALNTSNKTLPGAINELNNKMPFSVTFTATPTANGNVSYSFGQNVIVLSAWALVGDMVVLPSSSTGAGTDGCSTWWFHVMSIFSSHSVITSNVTINCIYIKV